jgi:hypothetical protein
MTENKSIEQDVLRERFGMFGLFGEDRGGFWGQRKLAEASHTTPRNPRLMHLMGEFEQALKGLESNESLRLRARILCAKSKADLWYLRADVFDLIARAMGQQEAQGRLEGLNDLFESSGPRTGPIPL